MATLGAILRYLFAALMIGGLSLFALAGGLAADVEIIAVALAFVVFALVACVVLAIPLLLATNVTPINRIALGLLIFLIAALAALVFIEPLTSGAVRMTGSDSALLAELFIPCAIALLLQWWLVRRRWRHAHGLFPPGVDPVEASRTFRR